MVNLGLLPDLAEKIFGFAFVRLGDLKQLVVLHFQRLDSVLGGLQLKLACTEIFL